MVSAELALTLPAVIAVLALVLGLAAVGVRQVRAVGAANAAARAQLAGEDPYAAAARAYSAAQISVSGECAQASVSLPLALIALALLLSGVIALVAATYSGAAKAQSAADLAALAGAQALNDPLAAGGAQPCQQAGRVAGDNQASLKQCLIEGQDLIVRVSRPLNLGPWHLVANAAAKAGPDPNQQP